MSATDNATNPLKAAALRVLQRNRKRNQGATNAVAGCNFRGPKRGLKVAPVLPGNFYDGRLSRPEAERHAARRIYSYRLTYHPDLWHTLLARPGDDLAEAERHLQHVYGADKVLDVQPYHWRAQS